MSGRRVNAPGRFHERITHPVARKEHRCDAWGCKAPIRAGERYDRYVGPGYAKRFHAFACPRAAAIAA